MGIRFNARTSAIETDAASIDFTQPITTPASTTSLAGLNIAEGVAPSAPVDGDVWVTAAGEFNARLNGATVDLSAGGGGGTIGGSIADNQVAVGNGSNAIDGSANLTYDATTLTISSGLTPASPSLELNTNRPVLIWDEADAAADNGRWYMHASAETFELVAINDANSASEPAFTVNRTGTTIDSVAFNGAISGDSFSGDGSALTALTAANVSSGNLGSGVLPYVTGSATSSAFQIVFANTTAGTSGNFGLLMDDTAANFTYNPSTNRLEIGNTEYLSGAIYPTSSFQIRQGSAGNQYIACNGSSSVDLFYNGIMTTRAGGFGAGTLSIIEGDVAGDAGARILYFTDSGNSIKASIVSGSNSGDFVIDNNVANKDVVITTSGTGKILNRAVTRVEVDDAATAALVSALEVSATSTGTPAAGFGPSLDFYAETAAGAPGNQELVGKVGVEMTSVTAAAETGELVFYTMDLGGAAEQRWAMTGTAGGESQLIGANAIALFAGANEVISGGSQTEIFYSGTKRFGTAVGGDVQLFSDGNTSTEGRAINFSYQNGTVAAELGFRATSSFDLRNHLNGGGLDFSADDTGGTERNILLGDPDGATTIYYTGSAKLATTATGVNITSSLFLNEQASAAADVAGDGQLWVQNAAPNQLWFTNDTGVDYPVAMAKSVVSTNTARNMNVDSDAQVLINGMAFYNNSTAYTITLEPSTDTKFPVGSSFQILVVGTGTITISEGTGDTLWLVESGTVTDTAGGCTMGEGVATVFRSAAATWYIWGTGITA